MWPRKKPSARRKKKQGTKKATNVPSHEPGQSAGGKHAGYEFPAFDLGTAVRFPPIRLKSLYPTNTSLPLHVELPGFNLEQFPGLDVEAISLALKSGGLDVRSILLPAIK